MRCLSSRQSKCVVGAGHPYHLKTMEEKLFGILLWHKIYPAFWFLGMLLGLDSSNAWRLIQRLRPLLQKAADPQLEFYLKQVVKNIQKGKKKIASFADLQREFPEIAGIFVDVTEQQRLRPKNIPRLARSHLDRGFQGVKKDFPDHNFLIPIKCNRWKRTLTRSEQVFNTKLSKKRIKIEHVISKLKKYALLGSVFRNRITSYQTHFRNIAVIINFRLAFVT